MTRLPPPLPCRYLIIFPTPSTDSQIQADPSLTETQKTWHLNWMPHAFLASFRPQRQPKRFIGEIWVKFSGKRPGHPSHLCVHMLSHAHNALARILCSISTGSGGSSSYSLVQQRNICLKTREPFFRGNPGHVTQRRNRTSHKTFWLPILPQLRDMQHTRSSYPEMPNCRDVTRAPA